MTDLPPGEWTAILVGDQWPDSGDVAALADAGLHRTNTEAAFHLFADQLRNAQRGPLAPQHGLTADDLREKFRFGEHLAQYVSEKNGTKQRAYATALESIETLRQELTALAAEGNQEIKAIQNSKADSSTKQTQIIAAIHRYRALANLAAAKAGASILDAIQRILDGEGRGQSARDYARTQGANLEEMFRQPDDESELNARVHAALNNPTSPLGQLSNFKNPSAPPLPQQGSTDRLAATAGVGTSPHGSHARPYNSLPTNSHPSMAASATAAANPSGQGPQTQAVASHPFQGRAPSVTPPPTNSMVPTAPTVSMPKPPSSPLQELPTSVAIPPQLTPSELAQSFNRGLESGAPFSAAAPSLPHAATTSTEPQIAHPIPTTPAAVSTPQLHLPVTDSPAPVHHAPAPEATPPAPQTVAAAPPPIAPAVAPPAVGSLPSYGADLRPPISTTLTPPAPPSRHHRYRARRHRRPSALHPASPALGSPPSCVRRPRRLPRHRRRERTWPRTPSPQPPPAPPRARPQPTQPPRRACNAWSTPLPASNLVSPGPLGNVPTEPPF